MKKMKKRSVALALCAVGAAAVTGAAFLLFGTGVAESPTLSTGLQHLADVAHVAASAQAGQEIGFTPEWFDSTLQGGKVSGITVTALPDVTAGELMLGHGEVSVGQSISRENLSYLRFVPVEGVREASFDFLPTTLDGVAGYTLCCKLSLTDGVNCCPAASGSVMAVSTHESLALEGTLVAEDPEGDALYFEVVSYPERGTLTVEQGTGHFVYTPTEGFCGEDRFVWRVQDAHGALSAPCEVKVTVRELATGYLFCDVADSRTHTAALTLTERALMSGEVMGGKHYFHPERTLTRAGFVAVLLKAAEVKFEEADTTGYTDDAEIPHGMKGAIKYAKEQGWLGEDSVFRPHDPITRAEAASIAARALGLSAPGYSNAVEDHNAIPVSVVDALYAAYEGGYLATMADGTLAPANALTRGEAAVFFTRVCEDAS
jgi:hypothetical protein